MGEQKDTFPGFQSPKENWSKLPHQLIEALPDISSQGELMVILYILRHTWGYREYGQPKKITLDEFMHGRKTKNVEDYPTGRMDNGVGMSKDAILRGLKRAEKHGFIEIDVDDSDKARIKKYYVLRMSESQTPDLDVRKSDPEVPESDSQVRESDSNGKDFGHRSEKETLERNSQKEIEKESVSDFPENPKTPDPGVADSGKEIDDDKQETSGDHPFGHSERLGDLGVHDGESVEVDRDASVDASGHSVNGDHRPDPTLLALERRTAAARAEAGNYADPGEDILAAEAITCLFRGKPPKRSSGTWRDMVNTLEPLHSDWGLHDMEVDKALAVVRATIALFLDEKPQMAVYKYPSFAANYGQYLSRAMNGDHRQTPHRNDPAKFDEATRMTLERLNYGDH